MPRDEVSLILAFIRHQNLEKQFKQALDEYSLREVSSSTPTISQNVSNDADESDSAQETQYEMSTVRRRSIVGSISAMIGVNVAPDLHQTTFRDPFEREKQLPAYLRRIRKGSIRGGDGYYEDMVSTWNEALKSYSSADAAMSDFVFAWRLDEGSDFVQFLHAAKESQRRLLHQAKFGLIVRCLFSAFVSYADYFSDILLAVYYFTEGEMVYCGVTIAWPLIVLVCHALLAWADGEPWYVVLASLFGMKPLIDTYRFAAGERTDIKRQSPVVSMALGRGVELVFESIPQTGVQIVLILLQLSANVDVDSRQYVTVVTSLLAAGFIGANTDYDIDTNERLRRMEPILYGWLPESKSKRLAFMMMHTCHLGCFMGMRVLSCAALALISPLVFALWLAAEFFVFTAARIYFNTYTFFMPIPRLLQHVFDVLFFIDGVSTDIFYAKYVYNSMWTAVYDVSHIRVHCFICDDVYSNPDASR